ncbi:mucin-17-like [Ruditapes philippinarum]|uniref:mucin-17-like n=1 Tax=Ruditapes philippinarum TaxID=129788 RepID=UPI00295B9118|nr:mucin-17-like [Ruditapes philippinarum]
MAFTYMETSATSWGNETNISSYVFLDFETTSLLDRKCRITEMCLLAVNRVDLTAAGSFPRVTNKLTVCLDPQQPISMTSSNITGLYNDSLENQKAFTDETVALINAFLNHLRKPICLLAHNGNRFDFLLLVAELKRLNQSLDNSIWCADTLEAFRSLDGLPAVYTPSSNQSYIKKFQNSPNNGDKTPVTSAKSSTNTPLKRKGTTEFSTPSDNSPKVSKLEYSYKTNLSAEKVKKKLTFESIQDKTTDDTKQDKKETEEVEEATEEFSSSLDDTHYLKALESVEKGLCQETLVFNKSAGDCLSESTKKEQENEDTKSIQSPANNSTVLETSAGTCCVANGTGYYIRQSTQELLKEEKNAVPKRDESGGNITSSPVVKSEEPINITSPKLENCSKETEFSSGKKDQMSTTKTNFVVTLTSKQYSPLPAETNNFSSRDNCLSENKNVLSSSKKESIQPDVSNASNGSPVPLTSCQVSSCAQSNSVLVSDKGMSASSKVSSARTSTDVQIITRHSDLKSESTAVVSTLPANSTSFTQVSTSSDSANLLDSKSVFTSNKATCLKSSPLPTTPIVTNSVKQTQISGLSTEDLLKTKPDSAAGTQNGSPYLQRQSYKLEEIYLRKFGSRPPHSHKAEDDCITLLKIAKSSPNFMDWVDKNSELLSSIDSPF